MECTDGWNIDAELGFVPMEALGWQMDAVSWRTEAPDWGGYDAVYIGVPWDYPEDPEHFLPILQSIDESSAILVNDLELVHLGVTKNLSSRPGRKGRGPDGRFLIMELEMIEPSLYLRMDPDAPQRFADAFNSYVAKKDAERLQ